MLDYVADDFVEADSQGHLVEGAPAQQGVDGPVHDYSGEGVLALQQAAEDVEHLWLLLEAVESLGPAAQIEEGSHNILGDYLGEALALAQQG